MKYSKETENNEWEPGRHTDLSGGKTESKLAGSMIRDSHHPRE